MSEDKNDTKHRQVIVQVGDWCEAIDEQIAPLIREMWIAGIGTLMSCQEDGWGKVWLQFDDLSALTRFLNVVAQFEPGVEALYNRMNLQMWPENRDLLWEYELHPADSSFIDAEDGHALKNAHYEGPPDFYFAFSIRFPPSDLPTVIMRLQQYNQTQEAKFKLSSDDPAALGES